MVNPSDFFEGPDAPQMPGDKDENKPKEDPGSFSEYGDDAKEAGKEVAKEAADKAKDEALKEGASLADDLIQDAKNGNPPNPSAVKDRALGAGKSIAQNTGAAAIDAAKEKARQQVDKTLAIIGNEFPLLGGILGLLSKPIIDKALNACEMPDF
jgi:hypothetical protein